MSALLTSCGEQLLKGSADALEVATRAVSLARQKQKLLPEAIRMQVRVRCFIAQRALELEAIEGLEERVELEAKGLHEAREIDMS